MENVISNIQAGLKAITQMGIGVISISIIAEILFGTGALFGADVVGNLTSIVSTLGGQNGLVGLIALLLLVVLLKRD
tara:strand:- start:117 stop:347 length:231 start_codon:yes stop_codon:yes gene_type:complete